MPKLTRRVLGHINRSDGARRQTLRCVSKPWVDDVTQDDCAPGLSPNLRPDVFRNEFGYRKTCVTRVVNRDMDSCVEHLCSWKRILPGGKVLALLAPNLCKPIRWGMVPGAGSRETGRPVQSAEEFRTHCRGGALLQWRTLRAWIGARRYPNGKCRRRGISNENAQQTTAVRVYRTWGGDCDIGLVGGGGGTSPAGSHDDHHARELNLLGYHRLQ
jgi:hypothetical protein